MNDLCRRLGLGGAYASAWLRRLAMAGLAVTPMLLVDFLLRTSQIGDGYGKRRGGLSVRQLLKHKPHGQSLRADLPTGLLPKDRRINLALPELASEIGRIKAWRNDPAWPMRLIGMRELLSQNTWLHNVPSLMSDRRRHYAHINPEDAKSLGIGDGEMVSISSRAGQVQVLAKYSPHMKTGNVALPHGWGHQGGWKRANNAGGVNSNILAGKGMDDVELLAGMSTLNGIPVRIDKLS